LWLQYHSHFEKRIRKLVVQLEEKKKKKRVLEINSIVSDSPKASKDSDVSGEIPECDAASTTKHNHI